MNVLRYKTKQLYSDLLKIKGQVSDRFKEPPAPTCPSRVKDLLRDLITNRAEILEIAIHFRLFLDKLFSHSRDRSIPLFRFALDQAIIRFATFVPDWRQPRWLEHHRALDIIMRIITIVRLYVPGQRADRVNISDEVPELLREIKNSIGERMTLARKLARDYRRLKVRLYNRDTPLSPSGVALRLRSGCHPYLVNSAPFYGISWARGWRLGTKHNWRVLGQIKKDLPSWGARYLRWLNRALAPSLDSPNHIWVQREARVLYRIIRWQEHRDRWSNETRREMDRLRARAIFALLRPPGEALQYGAMDAVLGMDVNRNRAGGNVLAHVDAGAPAPNIGGGVEEREEVFVNPDPVPVVLRFGPVRQNAVEVQELLRNRVSSLVAKGSLLARLLEQAPRFAWYRARNTQQGLTMQNDLIHDILAREILCHAWPAREMREVWAKLPAPDREYYRAYFGFDPRDKVLIDQSGRNFYYEVEFPLASDPTLQQGGMTISARVEFFNNVVKNRIIFRRGGKETVVDCVHTAIYHATAGEFLDDGSPERLAEQAVFDHRLGAGHPLILPPEEHFVSLKSYVQGIAEMGIERMLRASYVSDIINPLTLPFGFNSAMQFQVIRAIRIIDTSASNRLVIDLLLHLFESIPEDWLRQRFRMLDSIYEFSSALFTDLETFKSIFEAMPRQWFASWAFSRHPPPEIFQFLISRGFQVPPAPDPKTTDRRGVNNGDPHWNAAMNIHQRVVGEVGGALRRQLKGIFAGRRGIVAPENAGEAGDAFNAERDAQVDGAGVDVVDAGNWQDAGGNLDEEEQDAFDAELRRREQEVAEREARLVQAEVWLQNARTFQDFILNFAIPKKKRVTPRAWYLSDSSRRGRGYFQQRV